MAKHAIFLTFIIVLLVFILITLIVIRMFPEDDTFDYKPYESKIVENSYWFYCREIYVGGIGFYQMTYYKCSSSRNIDIGCITKTKKEWDEYFSRSSNITYETERYTLKWYILKYRYEYFINHVEKQLNNVKR